MKVLFSQLKRYLPDLKEDARTVADVFTRVGYMLDKFFEIEYLGQKDFLLDLEVRQNRADCFGVLGLARELSAYYNIELKIEKHTNVLKENKDFPLLPINILANKGEVKAVNAVKITGIKLKESPQWLKDYLSLYDINSINSIVDLTNYVMIETAHPSHAFDCNLSGEGLTWEINPKYKTMVSLDSTNIELTPDALVVSDGTKPLAIAGVVGGKETGININTKEIIVEMAVYDGGLVRKNSRQMRIMTEASSRLEKYMDPISLSEAFSWLIALILEHSEGKIEKTYEFSYKDYEKEREIFDINLDKISQIAGIEITHEESQTYLERLGFEILNAQENILNVKRPINRLDVEREEDAIEEVIRLKGYDKIPVDILNIEITKDITPTHLKLLDKVQEILTMNNYDEVRSWILVDSSNNNKANLHNWKEIHVTNSINEEVPFLRQSISVSLLGQLENYLKNNIPDINIFEIGKVFGKGEVKHVEHYDDYLEHYSLGLLTLDEINSLKKTVEILLRQLGINKIEYKKTVELIPQVAHPQTIWDILIEGNKLGIIYVTNKSEVNECSIAEINLSLLDKLLNNSMKYSAQEIVQKLVELDTNIVIADDNDINKEVYAKLAEHQKDIWKWEILDEYKNDKSNDIKYTVRVYYMHLSDPQAKKLHSQIFK